MLFEINFTKHIVSTKAFLESLLSCVLHISKANVLGKKNEICNKEPNGEKIYFFHYKCKNRFVSKQEYSEEQRKKF